MLHTSAGRILTAVAVGFALIPLGASAADKKHETKAFSVTAPDTWMVKAHRVDKGGKTGHWVIKSAARNGKMYVRVGRAHKNLKLRQLFNRYLGENLRKYVRNIRIQSYEEKKFEGNNMALAFVYGVTKRATKGHIYKFGVLVTRGPDGRVLYAALGGTKEGWGALSVRLPTILTSLRLK